MKKRIKIRNNKAFWFLGLGTDDYLYRTICFAQAVALFKKEYEKRKLGSKVKSIGQTVIVYSSTFGQPFEIKCLRLKYNYNEKKYSY